MIKIDGSYGEGGGQVLRTSLTLSAITGKPFTLTPIRPRRERSGLQPQHLMACLAANTLCQGKLTGAVVGSDSLVFEPGEIKGGEYQFDIGTAGSVPLLAQALIPICLYARENTFLHLKGGTHIKQSPGYDYFAQIFLPAINQFGAHISTKLIRVGYYPKGGGMIELEITPQKLHGCTDWKKRETTFAIVRSSRLPKHIVDRESQVLIDHGIENITFYEDASLSPGNAITLCKGFNGAYVLGEIGKRAEKVAEEAVVILEQENAEVDRHLADQLLIYAALAIGKTSYATSEITEHLQTNKFVIAKFIDRPIAIEANQVRL